MRSLTPSTPRSRRNPTVADFVRIRAADVPKDAKPDGARLRLIRDDGEGICELYDEQVTYPERVHNPNASNFKFQNHLALNEDEQRWLRDALTEMLGEVVDTAALHDEIAKLRAGIIPTQINAVFEAALRFGMSKHTGDANCSAGGCEARCAEIELRELVMSVVSDETKKRIEASNATAAVAAMESP